MLMMKERKRRRRKKKREATKLKRINEKIVLMKFFYTYFI